MELSSNKICIQIFTKAPIEGYCKTRLAPHLGESETVSLQMEMIQKTILTSIKINTADVQLWCKPSTQHSFFQKMAEENSVSLHEQKGETLGDIMNDAALGAENSYANIVQIGTDCPYIDADYILAAIDQLDADNRIVIGPANDGGYVLLAQNQCFAEIYNNIDWGMPSVLGQLEMNLKHLKIKHFKLASLSDIDTFSDYQQWKITK